ISRIRITEKELQRKFNHNDGGYPAQIAHHIDSSAVVDTAMVVTVAYVADPAVRFQFVGVDGAFGKHELLAVFHQCLAVVQSGITRQQHEPPLSTTPITDSW